MLVLSLFDVVQVKDQPRIFPHWFK